MDNDVSFGLTDQDLKNNKIKNILTTIKNFFSMIAPTVIRFLNIIIYYIIKFIKSIAITVYKMILGKEV